MPTIPLGPAPSRPGTAPGWAPFALGFRPFFLAAGLAGVILVGWWLAAWSGRVAAGTYYGGPMGWHGHEMLFGYAMAVIAGFLLTAARNWTGISTPTGKPLAALALLWLVGRLAPLLHPLLPPPLVAAGDWLFIPALALALAGPLWRGTNRVNRLFLPLLAAMALANLLVHLEALGFGYTARRGNDLMVVLVVLLIAFVGGRIMPFFTEKAVTGAAPRTRIRLEQAAFACLAALAAVQLLHPEPGWIAALSLLVALTQAARLAGWHHPGVWRIPILWVLYTGFGWLVTGFLLQALAGFGRFPPNLALHALTLGGVGVLTLGMMARVTLGHTGRDLRPAGAMHLAFVLLNLGAAVRVFGPLLGDDYPASVHLAGGLWLLAFATFLFVYGPMLLKGRVDGRPG